MKSYFVDVAASDLYNEDEGEVPITYNGPYTITMKDITGVQRTVTNIDPTLGSPVDYETGLSLSDGDTITLAAPFITGDHPEGYALDRIRVPFDDIADDGASPLISIYSNSSDTPSAKLCDLDRPATDRRVSRHLERLSAPVHIPGRRLRLQHPGRQHAVLGCLHGSEPR